MFSPPPFTALMKLAWQHYVNRFDVFLLVNLAGALPLYISVDISTPREILQTLADRSAAEPDSLSAMALMMREDFFWLLSQPAYTGHFVIQIMSAWLVTLVPVSIMVWIKAMSQRKQIPPADALRGGLVFYPSALVAVAVIGVLTTAGYIAFFIPGVIISLFLVFTLPAMVLRNKSIISAMNHSIQLVKRHWVTVLTYVIGAEFIVGLITIGVVFALPTALGFDTAALTIGSIINSFTVVFVVLLFSALEALEHVKQHATPESSVPPPSS